MLLELPQLHYAEQTSHARIHEWDGNAALSEESIDPDPALSRAWSELVALDPLGARFAQVFRETFDQLYDGQRTGRYKWDQLYKTEKTHFGTLIEINLQREFKFADGKILDYQIGGEEVDCKYSFREGGWMLPPESWGELILVATASDEKSSWSLGLVRVTEANRRQKTNRDDKSQLSIEGRSAIRWLFRNADMSPNVLLTLPVESVDRIFNNKRGQGRLDQLFREAEGLRIHRSTIATVAQQYDYMKRVRYNGGSRSTLQPEGFLILGGDYALHRELSKQFGLLVPNAGEFVSFRVVPASHDDPTAVALDGERWRVRAPLEAVEKPAPYLPKISRGEGDGEL